MIPASQTLHDIGVILIIVAVVFTVVVWILDRPSDAMDIPDDWRGF